MIEPDVTKIRTSPYPGCRNYDASDAEWFFGRRRERDMVISNLFNSRSRLTIYYGASGVGKTSLLLADVVPVLKGKKRPPEITDADRRRFDSSVVVVFRGWQDPLFQHSLREEILASVLERMNRVSKNDVKLDEVALRKKIASAFEEASGDTDATGLAGKSDADIRLFLFDVAPLPEFITACCRVAGQIFLIFDQFEEYFRYFADSSERELFDGEFATLVNSPEIPVTILVSLREDGLSKLDRLQLRIPNLFENMLRLEHLDEQGAREAIKVPLDHFNDMRRANAKSPGEAPPPIIFQPRLIDELAREVAPRPSVIRRSGLSASEGGPSLPVKRYQGASYLQILLASAWREVEQRGKTELTVETLIEAARNYARTTQEDGTDKARDQSMDFATCAQQIAASYVFCIMESELEAARLRMADADRIRIGELGLPRMRDTAASVLRYLVTPGGAKMAHTVDTLAEWANAGMDAGESSGGKLSTEEIDLTMRLLGEAGIVRRTESGNTRGTVRYEVAHDVLGTPLDKWRETHERKRDSALAAEKAKADEEKRMTAALQTEEAIRVKVQAVRRLWAAVIFGTVAVAAIVATAIAIVQTCRANFALTRAQYVRSADFALQFVKSGTDLEIARIAALSSIPAVEEAMEMPAPPQTLIALRFSTLFSGQDLGDKTPEWINEQLALLDSYLPSLLSPDRKWFITLEGKQLYVWNTEQLYRKEKTLPAGDVPVSAMGFSDDSRTFFVACTDDSVVEWDMNSRVQKRHPKTKLEDLVPMFRKPFPTDFLPGIYPTYSSITAKWTQDALPDARELKDLERRGLPPGTWMQRIPIRKIVQAFDLGLENRSAAKSQLIDATKDFVVIDEKTADSLIIRGNGLRLVEEANRLAGNGDLEKAKAKYQDAMNANPDLKLDPEHEANSWRNIGLYQTAIDEGSNAEGTDEARKAFERAKALRPDLWNKRNAYDETKRPVESSAPTPSGPGAR